MNLHKLYLLISSSKCSYKLVKIYKHFIKMQIMKFLKIYKYIAVTAVSTLLTVDFFFLIFKLLNKNTQLPAQTAAPTSVSTPTPV